jgi:hypothetical protein
MPSVYQEARPAAHSRGCVQLSRSIPPMPSVTQNTHLYKLTQRYNTRQVGNSRYSHGFHQKTFWGCIREWNSWLVYIYIYIRYKVPGLFSYWSFESNGCEIFSSFLLDIHMRRRRRRLIPARHQYNIPPAAQKNVSFLSIFGLLKVSFGCCWKYPDIFSRFFFDSSYYSFSVPILFLFFLFFHLWFIHYLRP